MDNIIKYLEREPFSNDDIMYLCDNKTNIIKYSDLINYDNIDNILSPHNNTVILYETGKNYGHWVCLIKQNNLIEFFDPYGMKIDEQLKYSKNKDPLLSLLLLKSPYLLKENTTRLQKMYKNISTCGRHVCLRIILKELKLNEYIKLLKNNKNNPDLLVTYLTSFVK